MSVFDPPQARTPEYEPHSPLDGEVDASREPTSGNVLSRRNLFRLAGAAAAVGAVKYISAQHGPRPVLTEYSGQISSATSAGKPEPAISFSTTPTTPTTFPPAERVGVPNTVSQNTLPQTTDVQEPPQTIPDTVPEATTPPTPETILSPEHIVDGLKIGEVSVTNTDGTRLIHIPLIVNLYPGENDENYNRQLDRGAVLEVNKKDINPEIAYAETALPGEIGDTVLFAHRATRISPDFDGDGKPDDVPKQEAFSRINEIKPGAILELNTVDGNLRYELAEPINQEGILVVDSAGNSIPDAITYLRSQNTEEKRIILIACHPYGEVSHRIYARFRQLN